MSKSIMMVDGNEAVAHIAYALNEVIAIYPITPSSTMGEYADQWASEGRANLWGEVPSVVEMQSEGGAAGAVHGALQAGALTTTFTASQGLLLMIPNMYKIAGELTPLVIHVASRALAAQGLSIFGDHSDVMACRATGFAMLNASSVQEAADMVLIAHAATLECRIPFLHFFDGFRTSHEVNRIEMPTPEQMQQMIDAQAISDHRHRALSPDHPVIRGTAQNPDVYFQAREAVNSFYLACPEIVRNVMRRFAGLTGRNYDLVDYFGAPDAQRVIVMMGSGGEAVWETVRALQADGEKVGLLKVRLYRPFPAQELCAALPPSVRTIAVLDRTKEPGSIGEPLYLDVLAALDEFASDRNIRVIGGRYGLASKEFTPAMVCGIYEELAKPQPRRHFTIGIQDDVTHTSLSYDGSYSLEHPSVVRCLFYGLGADGTVGANKNSIKIIGEETDNFAQGYFVYDSKKSGSMTISHLRFGPQPIRSTYLISHANFIACHQFAFLERLNVLECAETEATFLINSPHPADQVWAKLPSTIQNEIVRKRLKVYVIDADSVAREAGLRGRISTIMQTCFFKLSGVMPLDDAIAAVKQAIVKSFGKRGQSIVDKNFAAVDQALSQLHPVAIPASANSAFDLVPPVSSNAPDFVRNVTARIISGHGDELPVSALPPDGTWPVGTTRWEKRNIASEIPVWDEKVCIQCGKCVMVCPHAVIRAKIVAPEQLTNAPPSFKSVAARWPDRQQEQYTLQVSPEDCTGCALCVEVCPAKNKSEVRLKAINMMPVQPLRNAERINWDYFLALPDPDRSRLRHDNVKDTQLLEPLFEFSGACAGCGETPYLKLLTQLVGDRMLVANATGCSSIYGGNLPTTPWAKNQAGRGPAWSNSLFEDNAEFGLGMRLSLDMQQHIAIRMVREHADRFGREFSDAILNADQTTESGVYAQRERIAHLKQLLQSWDSSESRRLQDVCDALVRKSVWIIGGDGWAYDIGFGGVDHVIATGSNVKLLVLDTEVYSNTGGQMSKATPLGAVAKFASGGKLRPKKDLAMMAMTYGNVYVARIAMGANDAHTIKVLQEADQFPGPALVIAYSPCIAHGYDLVHSLDQQKGAVQSGYWPLMRFDPTRSAQGLNPLQLDSKTPSLPLEKFAMNETRFTMLKQSHPQESAAFMEQAQALIHARWKLYETWATPTDRKIKQETAS